MTTESNQAVLYLRSSKDRADVSIDAQRRALQSLATDRRLDIVNEYVDAVESGSDEDRPAFQCLLYDIKESSRGWTWVLTLDTSRIARRRQLALFFEHECEKRRVQIIYKNVPETDAITSMLLKSILQALDEWHSLTSKAKGLAGMAENVRQGWRAGGRAPRGYRLTYETTGAIREGSPVLKSRLEPDEEAPKVAAYLSARAAGLRRAAALKLAEVDWPVASLNGLEWQALTYAGHTVWNVHNEKGLQAERERRRPRAEWVITRDTHTPLISEDEAETILTRLADKRQERTSKRSHNYLLTGLLFTEDGTMWSGDWDYRSDVPMYRLGKGKRVRAHVVDQAVLSCIEADLKNETVAQRLMHTLTTQPAVDGRKLSGLERRHATLNQRIEGLVRMMPDMESDVLAPVQRTLSAYDMERKSLAVEIKRLKDELDQHQAASAITLDDVRRLLSSLFEEIQTSLLSGNVETTKAAIGSLVERIELDPTAARGIVYYRISRPATGIKLASPRGFEPLYPP